MRTREGLAMTLAALALTACHANDRSVDVRTVNDEAPQASPGELASATNAGSPSGGASPIEDYRKARTAKAMRGVLYDSGRVVIDEAAAREIVPNPDPSQAAAEFSRGEHLLYQENNREEAIAAFTRAVIHDPARAESYDGLGRALATKGKSREAIAAYRTALDLEPRRVDTTFNLAVAFQMSGQADEALRGWERTLKLDPNHAEAHSRLAIERYYRGENAASWRHVHAAEALGHPVPPQFRVLLEGQMAEPDAGN